MYWPNDYYESTINKYVLKKKLFLSIWKKSIKNQISIYNLSVYPFLSKRDQTLSYKIIIYQRNRKIHRTKNFINQFTKLKKIFMTKEDYFSLKKFPSFFNQLYTLIWISNHSLLTIKFIRILLFKSINYDKNGLREFNWRVKDKNNRDFYSRTYRIMFHFVRNDYLERWFYYY